MSQPSETHVQDALAARRAHQEAVERETATGNKFVNIARAVLWCGALIPGPGILFVILGLFVGLGGGIYNRINDNKRGAAKQFLISILGSFVMAIVWAVISFMVFVG